MAVGDVDHTGWKDVVTGVNGVLYLVKLSWTGSTIAKTTITLGGSYFVQNITFGDIDNDGWLDVAVCDDVDYMKIYKNTAGTLNLQAPATAMINTNINPGMTYSGDPYDSGNYGSVWLDIDDNERCINLNLHRYQYLTKRFRSYLNHMGRQNKSFQD